MQPTRTEPPLQGQERECHQKSKIVIFNASEFVFTLRRPTNLM